MNLILYLLIYLLVGAVAGHLNGLRGEEYDSPGFALLLTVTFWPAVLLFWLLAVFFGALNALALALGYRQDTSPSYW
jgi:hypothetical protein